VKKIVLVLFGKSIWFSTTCMQSTISILEVFMNLGNCLLKSSIGMV